MSALNQTTPVSSSPAQSGWVRVVIIGRNWKLTLARLAVLVVTCIVVFRLILLPVRVEGISMQPTYRNGSVNFVNRLAYWRHGPKRGDVVGIRLSDPSIMWPSLMYLKRVIGLPGETVTFVNGTVYINGRALNEPYEPPNDCDWDLPPVKLGPTEYFVVGDNRAMPAQFHEHGKVESDHIVGKAVL
jgi:signal peptidase I